MGQNDDNELTSAINNNSQSKIGAKIGVAWVLIAAALRFLRTRLPLQSTSKCTTAEREDTNLGWRSIAYHAGVWTEQTRLGAGQTCVKKGVGCIWPTVRKRSVRRSVQVLILLTKGRLG